MYELLSDYVCKDYMYSEYTDCIYRCFMNAPHTDYKSNNCVNLPLLNVYANTICTYNIMRVKIIDDVWYGYMYAQNTDCI